MSSALRGIFMKPSLGQHGAMSIFRTADKKVSFLNPQALPSLVQGRRHFSALIPHDVRPNTSQLFHWYRAHKEIPASRPSIVVPDKMPYKKFMGKYSTPLLTEAEAETYLRPLFYRGWDIKKMDLDDGFNEPIRQSPFLVGTLVLSSFRSIGGLMSLLNDTSQRENHHVFSSVTAGRRPVLTIIAQTHIARKNASDSSKTADADIILPGITLRDIRIAALLEQEAFENNYLYYPKTVLQTDYIDQFVRDKNAAWKDLMSRYPWQ